MLWYNIALLGLPALARSHASHHVDEDVAFSQERLDELEKKWGIDVSFFTIDWCKDCN
jgi:agmatinase